MGRLVWPGVVWLLVVGATPLAAQRTATLPAPRLEEPRPAPALPAALVPFTIPADYCRGGVEPLVSLRVYDVLSQPVHVLRLRGRDGRLLDRLPLDCGTHVGIWNGTIDDPPRLPLANVYYLQLQLEWPGGNPRLATHKVVVPQY